MTKTLATIADYGMGNVLSVSRAFERFDCEISITDSASAIENAQFLILPGVGAFPDGMSELERRGLIELVNRFAASCRCFLGICLGMQMMLDASEDFGTTKGLGLIPGKVAAIPKRDAQGHSHKIPHIG